MAKIIIFLTIVFIMIFPIFISNKHYKKIPEKKENKPLIEIIDGKYKKYNNILEINGSFSKANIYLNYYQFDNLFADNLVKKEKYFAKWAFRKNNIIKAKIVKYINNDYNVHAKNVLYNEKKKLLKGWDFTFNSNKAKGKGKYFEIDKHKHLFAKNIIYYIKVEK
ncbi:conserved hypothetical protein [Lebetimonas natsushimae]|uniref:Lipopolysaccharide export system protein LptC n=1 Tax=Lebetimonas natsushimae TaxID=1936991 RepID=A0A292YEV3_9BACT|nr:hypothetical protein [Lebetimonas natsushimae]GAX88038.1 conserved hypothetical protein [Lebetimonas natsushimae]